MAVTKIHLDDSITGIFVVDLPECVNSFVNKASNFLLEVHQEVVDHLVENGHDINHPYFTPLSPHIVTALNAFFFTLRKPQTPTSLIGLEFVKFGRNFDAEEYVRSSKW